MHDESQVVTLGPEGTYSWRVARSIGDRIRFRESVTAVLAAIDGGEFERGVIPVETGIEGSVAESLDALAEHQVAVTTELVAPIDYALLGQQRDVETIVSHAQAIAHCQPAIREAYPDVRTKSVSSTVQGVELAIDDPTVGAIAHPSTVSSDSSLRTLDADVQPRESTVTRFFVLGRASERTEAGSKSTVIVYPSRDAPGILVDLLRCFAKRDINVTRLDARPSGKRLGDYVIHVDLQAGYHERRTQDAITAITEEIETDWMQWLGSYDVDRVTI